MQLTFVPVLVVSLILAVTNMVMAGSPLLPDRDACWERLYDDAHLKAHPRQQVVQIRLFHLPSHWPRPAPGVTFVTLEMNLRARTREAMRSTTVSAGSAGGAVVGYSASQNGAPVVGGSTPA
jgi:hypothetical protein